MVPQGNGAHSGRGCSATSGLGLRQLSLDPGSAAPGPPSTPEISPPPRFLSPAPSQGPPESGSHAQRGEMGPKLGPRRPHQARTGEPRRQRGSRAAEIRTRSRPRPRRHRGAHPGPAHTHRSAHTHPAAPPPPGDAEGRGRRRPTAPQPPGTAARAPPAARAALPSPAPGPGRPRAVTPPGGAARRARLRAQREAGSRRSRAGSYLSSARLPPGTRGSASALADHVRFFWGSRGGAVGGPDPGPRDEFPPSSEPRSPDPEGSGLPLRSSPRLTTIMGPGG